MIRRAISIGLLAIAGTAVAQPNEEPSSEDAPKAAPLTDAELLAQAEAEEAEAEVVQDGETVYIVPKKDVVVPGAAQAIDEAELERFEHDDVHRILGDVSGVYIREEDGYGLRPNIGMRGSGSERSAKIALMEDGILIAPAPYSAPAAYYFPLLTKMTRIEVLKGPASVRYGPNTVGGALNMLTRAIPRKRETGIDVAAGNDLYGKLHGYYGENSEHVGMLIEGLKLRTDGFKELDGGGDTGFDKNDIALKLRVNSDIKSNVYHEVVGNVGYSTEVSNETYAGLTDADFAANPYRRYVGTQLDRMYWEHLQVQLRHKLEVGARFSLVTQLYRHNFDRSWRKLNGFSSADIADVLASPDAGNNALLYAILTGAADSTSDAEALIVGTNRRSFVSQGVQTAARVSGSVLGLDHQASVGLRLHYDSAVRDHTEQRFFMADGTLSAASDVMTTRDTLGEATAFALYAQDEANYGPLTLSIGNRVEVISITHTDRADSSRDESDRYAVMIPGGGLFYRLLPELGVLAGVHKGFIPVAPGQGQDVNPEESINYELGTRFGFQRGTATLEGEVIGFFNDYSNLKGTCTFSTGCDEGQVGDEFNGGSVHTRGVESSASATIAAGDFQFPVRGTYTFNRSRFQSSFASANPQWGNVEEGDEIPYLPSHQLSLGAGVIGKGPASHVWELSISSRFTSQMRDTAGRGEPTEGGGTDSQTVFDAAASYQVAGWGRAYLTVSNIFDQAHIVSRRPFGARPGKPRFFILGYKNRF